MAEQKNQPSTNLLFSPANNDLFNVNNSSAFLVPVQGTTSSALMTSENPAEEDSFLGQNNAQQPATFSLFTGAEGSDPFSAVGNAPPGSKSSGITTSEQEPSLFVPSSTRSSPPLLSTSSYSTSSYSTPLVNSSFQSPTPMAMSSTNGIAPPPTQSYSGTPSGRLSHYSTPRYVPPPDYGIAPTSATPVSFPPSGNAPPPPMAGFTPSPYAPNVQYNAAAPPPSFAKLADSTPPPPSAESMYHLVSSHWCYSKTLSDGSLIWNPFSYFDSQNLEEAARKGTEEIVITDGGRYDVAVKSRERTSVYWEEPVAQVRRCTWFAKADTDHRYEPFDEALSLKLEEEYKKVVIGNTWHKQIDLSGGEMIVIHNPQVIVHLIPRENEVGMFPEQQMKSRIVKRGITEIDMSREIPENEIGEPDHVVFVCHGIGPVCDLRSRTIVECVDDIRAIQLSLLKSHFKNALEGKRAQRIEFLPIHWHRALHGDANGVDRDIRRLTLPSIQRLRHFTNETLLDILFYSSPVYCQTIAETIGAGINSLHQLFLSRNPNFNGKFSIAGHSLGALMVFDLLCNQGTKQQTYDLDPKPSSVPDELTVPQSNISARSSTPNSTQDGSLIDEEVEETTLDDLLAKLNLVKFKENFEAEQMEMDTLLLCGENDLKDLGLPMGPRKKLVGYLKQQQQEQERKRQEKDAQAKRLEEERRLMEQKVEQEAVAPVNQRMESVTGFLSSAMNVHVDFQQYDCGTGQPMVKYPQLQFDPEIFFTLGSPIGMFLTVRGISDLGEEFCLPTCGRFFNVFHPYDPVAYRVEPLINPEFSLKPVQVPHYKGRKRLHLELRDSLGRMGTELKQGIINSVKRAIGSMQKFAQNWQGNAESSEKEMEEEVEKVADELLKQQSEKSHENDDIVSVASESSQIPGGMGRLNGGQRIDYVLQERPLESFNDYLFAFQSHLCYWNSEDTVLLMMKEIYRGMDILSDSQIQKIQAAQQVQTLPPTLNQPLGLPPPPMSSYPVPK
ncbi:triacylglycerol hydrolase DDHD2-like [Styela clava]